MTTEPTKNIWQSRTIVTALILIIIGVLEFFGIPIPDILKELLTGEETVNKITEANEFRGVINVIIGLAITYFRISARKAVEGGATAIASPFVRAYGWFVGLFKKKE